MLSEYIPDRATRLTADPLHRVTAWVLPPGDPTWTLRYHGNAQYELIDPDADMREEREIGRLEAYIEAFVILLSLYPVVIASQYVPGWVGAVATFVAAGVALAVLGEVGNVEISAGDWGDNP